MSGALDTLTAEEQAALNQMQADDLASGAEMEAADTPAPTSTPETTAAPAPVKADEQKQTMVDKRALDEERARRRDLEAKLQAREIEQAKLSERMSLLMEAAKVHAAQPAAPVAPPAPPTPAPDFATDPAGFIKHNFETLGHRMQEMERNYQQKLEALEQGTTRLTQHQQQAAAINDLDQWGASQEQEYAKATPDYYTAMEHLRQSRANMMQLMGITDPAQIRNQLLMDVRHLAQMTRERGGNFAETLYKLAQAQGYKKAEDAPVVPTEAPAPANAAERLIRGQDMATTLGATGAAPRGEPAPNVLANMSDAEFAEYYKKVQSQGGAALRNLFGA